jgi:hypothetical protein
MIEAQAQEAAFPTVADVLESVRASAIESVITGETEAFADAFSTVFTSNPLESDQPDMALINLIAYAGAAFAVAEIYRADGNDDQADMLHAMGQDMLAQALETLGVFMASVINMSGTTRH